MKVYRQYILKEHLYPFIFALAVLLFILLTNFLLRALDKFLGKGLGIMILIEYVALNLAWILALAVPMAVLVATLMAFGRMSSDNEITALRTAGMSYPGIIQPALVFGVLVCLALALFNNQLLPEANHKARLLSSDISRKRPDLGIESGYFLDNLPSYAMIVGQRSGTDFEDITIYSKDNKKSQITIFADRGTMESIDDAVLLFLEDGEIHEISLPDYDQYRRLKFDRHRIVIPVDNLYLERRESEHRGDREMNIKMMLNKIDDYRAKITTVKKRVAARVESQTPYRIQDDTTKVNVLAAILQWQTDLADSNWSSQRDSIRITRRARNMERGIIGDYNLIASYQKGVGRYWVEIHKKLSIPFACIVFILVGAPVGIMAQRGGFAVASAMSLGFFVIYWALLIGGEELADRGLLRPFTAMWAPNILLGFVGILLIWRIQREQRVWTMDILDFFRRKIGTS